MTIETRKARPLSEEELKTYVKKFDPPREFVEFVRANNGCEFEENYVEGFYHVSIDELVDVAKVEDLMAEIEYFPRDVILFGSFGGDFFYFKSGRPEVFYWNHELHDENVIVADSFGEFLNKLIPDEIQVELDPDQVISVSINPKFKAVFDKLKKKGFD